MSLIVWPECKNIFHHILNNNVVFCCSFSGWYGRPTVRGRYCAYKSCNRNALSYFTPFSSSTYTSFLSIRGREKAGSRIDIESKVMGLYKLELTSLFTRCMFRYCTYCIVCWVMRRLVLVSNFNIGGPPMELVIVYFFHHRIILFTDCVTSCWIIIYAADINNNTFYRRLLIKSLFQMLWLEMQLVFIWFIFVQKIMTIQFTCYCGIVKWCQAIIISI